MLTVPPFVCNINPMSFTKAKGSLLKEAGCNDIRFGIESGSERIKKDIMKRVVSNESVRKAFEVTTSLGLMSSSFNMIGLPTETKEEVFETLQLNARLLPDTIKLMTFYPFKNTPLYDLCKKLDLIDYKRKKELDDYDTFTCLKFSPEHQLFLEKVQSAFGWYINIFLDNEASTRYRNLVLELEAMGREAWHRFDFDSTDKVVSGEFRDKGITHYARFANRSLVARYPSRHFEQE
ncbi:MAG: radical SAM protein [Proteobacteria bacterium]|nr:radical SAM protein [Pseudomonadota bacterium]